MIKRITPTDEAVEQLAQFLENMAAEVRRRRPVDFKLDTSSHVIELPMTKSYIERASGGLSRLQVDVQWDVDPEAAARAQS